MRTNQQVLNEFFAPKNGCGCSASGACFAAGTLVHTKDGLKPIQEIQVGDWVLSKPEGGSGETSYKRVTRTVSFEDQAVWTIEVYKVGDLDDKGMYRAVKRLIGTPSHRVWVVGQGWTELRKVTIHDQLVMGDGALAGVTHINILSKTNISNSTAFDLWAWDLNRGKLIDIAEAADGNEECTPGHLVYAPLGLVCDFDDPATYFRVKVYNFEVEDFYTYFVGSFGVWVRDVGGIESIEHQNLS